MNRSRLGIDAGSGGARAYPGESLPPDLIRGWPPVRRQGYAPKSTLDWQGVTALSRRRQADPEAARLARPRRDGRVAAMQARDLPHQGEAEAGALAVAADPMER